MSINFDENTCDLCCKKAMDETIIQLLTQQLPSVALMFYVWWTANKMHAKEREEWRAELRASNEILNKVTEQVNQLTFIIQNYVINHRKNTNRE